VAKETLLPDEKYLQTSFMVISKEDTARPAQKQHGADIHNISLKR
jgi:hypothetical protein